MRVTMLVGVVLVGCGGGEPTDTSGGGGTGPLTFSISAADGGTVEAYGATLEIPPGSLSEDTEITVTMVSPDGSTPDADTVVGSIFDFGPDGTVFDPPATLTLQVDRAPASGKAFTLSWLDAAWVDLPSTTTTTTVTAPVEHFTWFVVREVDAGATTTADLCDFAACGGDPVGSWNIAGICLAEVATLPCPGSTLDVALDSTGTYDILANGTYTYDVLFDVQFTMTLPSACLPGVTSCSQLDDTDLTCSGDPTVECTCTSSSQSVEAGSGTWSTNGTEITTTDDADGTVDVSPYCVDGNTLKSYDTYEGTILTLIR